MLEIIKSTASGKVVVPPSKSYAHRLLIAAALTNETCKVENIELSNDIIATINCLETLGKKITVNKNTVTVNTIKKFSELDDNLIFECLESGSTLRFFIPIALTLGKTVIFKGTEKLLSRGISVYEEICKEQDIEVLKEKELISFKGILKPSTFNIPGNISSQFITGLLFALPLLNGNSYINITTTLESANYIDITLDVLRLTGIEIVNIDNRYIIKAPQEYLPAKFSVEGDYSKASFLDAFDYLGGNVELNGLKEQSMQGDKIYKKYFNLISKGYAEIDLQNAIDLGPILFVMASLFHGAHFINTNRLKIKESNRINDLQEELNKFGIELKELDNEVFINKQEINFPTEVLDGHNDHRIVMALTVLLSTTGGKIVGVEAVSKSYPTFFEDISNLGIEVRKC
jgi:3-phosphoshikimate 1-carboxyvinyltransferase